MSHILAAYLRMRISKLKTPDVMSLGYICAQKRSINLSSGVNTIERAYVISSREREALLSFLLTFPTEHNRI